MSKYFIQVNVQRMNYYVFLLYFYFKLKKLTEAETLIVL